MAHIALFTEFSDGQPKSVTLEILGKLSDHRVDVFGVGDLSPIVDELKKYGAFSINSLKAPSLEYYSPDAYADLLASFIKANSFDYLCAGSTPLVKDLFPRLSGILDVGMASEITEMAMDGDILKATRPLFAGKILADVEVIGPKPHIYTIRPNALGMPTSPLSQGSRDQDYRSHRYQGPQSHRQGTHQGTFRKNRFDRSQHHRFGRTGHEIV